MEKGCHAHVYIETMRTTCACSGALVWEIRDHTYLSCLLGRWKASSNYTIFLTSVLDNGLKRKRVFLVLLEVRGSSLVRSTIYPEFFSLFRPGCYLELATTASFPHFTLSVCNCLPNEIWLHNLSRSTRCYRLPVGLCII